MSVSIIACPYCNAHVPRPHPIPPGGRVLCPRCGEMFSYRPSDEGDNQPPQFGEPAWNNQEQSGSSVPAFSNKTVAAAVLGGMAFMAGGWPAFCVSATKD